MRLVLVVCLLACSGVYGAELSNARCRLAFSEDGRSLAALAPAGKPEANLLSGAETMYQAYIVTPDGKEIYASPKETAPPKQERTTDGLRLTFASSPHHPATVVCSFTAPAGSPFIEARVSVTCQPNCTLTSIRFPVLSVTLPCGATAEDDEIAFAKCDGSLFKNPSALFKPGAVQQGSYPGGMSMQWMACGDKDSGLYCACHDGEGWYKEFRIWRTQSGMTLAPVHRMSPQRGTQYAQPYAVALSTYDGGWMRAADLYKSWATQQPWCAKRLTERPLPEWLRQGPFFHAVSCRQHDGADFLPQMPEYIAGYRKLLNWPICAMMMAWEKHDAWVTPDYFPPYRGAELFKSVTSKIRRQGNATFCFLSGLHWTLEKTKIKYNDWEDFKREGKASAIAEPNGEPRLFGKPERGVGRAATICAATPLAKRILVDATLGCLDLGLMGVQVDQIVGGGQPPCYSTQHGHAPGPGKWIYEALYDDFSEVVKRGRARSSEYAFAIEEPGELYIPLLDCYHARDYAVGRWPRSGPGNAYPAPLFTYVYHEYCLGYGGDSASLATTKAPLLIFYQAMNLVCGKTPGGCVWGRRIEASELEPSLAQITRGHCALLRAGLQKYLLFGTMRDFDLADSPPLEYKSKVGRWALPSVPSSAFASADGGLGYVFANVSDEARTLELSLQAYGLEAGPRKLIEYRGVEPQKKVLAEAVKLPHRLQLRLEPYEVVLVEAAKA